MWNLASQGSWAWIRLHHRLKCLKIHFKEWNKSVFGNVSLAKNDILVNIQILDRKEADEGL